MADIPAIDLDEARTRRGAFAFAADGPAKLMMRSLAAAALGTLLASCQPSAPEAAQVEQAAAPKSGDPDVDALMEAIASRNEARARELVGDVGYLVVPQGLISSEDELLDRVLGCQVEDLTTANAVVKYRVVWKCPPAGGGEPVYYNAAIANEPPFGGHGQGLAVLEFSEGRTNSSLRAGVAPPPTARGN